VYSSVGDFYVHLVHHGTRTGTNNQIDIDDNLTSSTKLLSTTGKPTVIHFYDGGWGGCRPCAAQMEAWSKRIPQVQFLCVCVDGQARQVALSFHNMFFRSSNSNVVNGYIPSRGYMPVGYGQLGCSGFIVSDKDGNFLSKKTRAYLQFGEAAFDYVESLLAPHIVIDLTSDGDCEEEKKEEEVVDDSKKVEMPASVGVTAMDDEHQECTDAFNQVIEHPTQETLKHLSEVLSCHFAHEEELMKQFSKKAKRRTSSRHASSNSNTNNTSNSMSSFSALDSHIMDHKRILNILNEEVHRLNIDSCGMGLKGKWHKVPVPVMVDLSVVQKVAVTFHVHAERFDALYDGVIPSHAQ